MFQRERERGRALPLGRYSSAPWGAGIPGSQRWRGLSPKAACLCDGCWGWGGSEDDDGWVLKRSCFGGLRRLVLLADFLRPSPEPCFRPRPPCGLVMASVHLHPNPGSAGRNRTEGIGPGPLGDGHPGAGQGAPARLGSGQFSLPSPALAQGLPIQVLTMPLPVPPATLHPPPSQITLGSHVGSGQICESNSCLQLLPVTRTRVWGGQQQRCWRGADDNVKLCTGSVSAARRAGHAAARVLRAP